MYTHKVYNKVSYVSTMRCTLLQSGKCSPRYFIRYSPFSFHVTVLFTGQPWKNQAIGFSNQAKDRRKMNRWYGLPLCYWNTCNIHSCFQFSFEQCCHYFSKNNHPCKDIHGFRRFSWWPAFHVVVEGGVESKGRIAEAMNDIQVAMMLVAVSKLSSWLARALQLLVMEDCKNVHPCTVGSAVSGELPGMVVGN